MGSLLDDPEPDDDLGLDEFDRNAFRVHAGVAAVESQEDDDEGEDDDYDNEEDDVDMAPTGTYQNIPTPDDEPKPERAFGSIEGSSEGGPSQLWTRGPAESLRSRKRTAPTQIESNASATKRRGKQSGDDAQAPKKPSAPKKPPKAPAPRKVKPIDESKIVTMGDGTFKLGTKRSVPGVSKEAFIAEYRKEMSEKALRGHAVRAAAEKENAGGAVPGAAKKRKVGGKNREAED